jgi:VanZ family protein
VSASVDTLAQPKLRFAWLWWAVGWALIIATVNESLQPRVWIGEVVTSDKLLHFMGYFALALWFGGVCRRSRYLVVAVLLIALGGALEIGQAVMDLGRQGDWRDFVANSLGISTGLAVCAVGLGQWMVWIERLVRPQNRPQN